MEPSYEIDDESRGTKYDTVAQSLRRLHGIFKERGSDKWYGRLSPLLSNAQLVNVENPVQVTGQDVTDLYINAIFQTAKDELNSASEALFATVYVLTNYGNQYLVVPEVNFNSIIKLAVENGITEIPRGLFLNVSGFAPDGKVVIPESITTIGPDAFKFAFGDLEGDGNFSVKATSPSLSKICNNAFEGSGLQAIDLHGSNVSLIEKGTFKSCESLRLLVLPEKINKVELDWFGGTLPEDIKIVVTCNDPSHIKTLPADAPWGEHLCIPEKGSRYRNSGSSEEE